MINYVQVWWTDFTSDLYNSIIMQLQSKYYKPFLLKCAIKIPKSKIYFKYLIVLMSSLVQVISYWLNWYGNHISAGQVQY